MVEIIPSINVRTFEEAEERIKKVEPHVRWCHLDVTDGVFSKHETWRNPKDLFNLKTGLNVEVHLMISEPEMVIEDWMAGPVKRVIVHLEAMKKPAAIIHRCKDAGVEIGFAVNPDTPWEELQPWFGKIDMVQVLTVNPGPSGQTPDWTKMLEKIKGIRGACPNCAIEVDGGINTETAPKVQMAGAGLLVAGNYIFTSDNMEEAIKSLSN